MKNKRCKNQSFSKNNCNKIKRRRNSRKSRISSDRDNEKEQIIYDNFEIIKLTDYCDDDDDEEDDCQWEDVPELPEMNDVILNVNEILSEDESKNKKRKVQQAGKETSELIKKIMLLLLVARVMYINKICKNNLILNLALSRFPVQFTDINCNHFTVAELHDIICAIKSEFKVIDNYSEEGSVRIMLIKGLEEKRISTMWLNVLLLIILRSAGFRCRLIAVLYPQASVNDKNLCSPSMYRTSRNIHYNKKQKVFLPKQPISLEYNYNPHILFTVEALDPVNLRWIPMDIKNVSAFDNAAAIVEDYPRFFYVIGVDNDGNLRDVAARYDRYWAESSRRSRLGRAAWEKMLSPFISSTIDKVDWLENEAIRADLLSRGIPRTLSDLKGHPVFVLRRNLLKYEVIYPLDTVPFGQFNDEDVFLRENVRTAHTRETWLKEALAIKDCEHPCKHVKTVMSTRKQKSDGKDCGVDLFGPWQVEDYVPPKAVNGIVPINNHGNVDMFKPSMVPEGCVHLRLKGIDKVAKQLNINYAAAMVGWEFVKRHRSVPVFDGWVVCKEYVKILTEALREWNKIEAEKRSAAREKIVIKRWEVLTRRILIRERLRREYNF